MPSDPSRPDEAGPWVRILTLAEDYAFGEFSRVTRAVLRYRRFDGQMSDPVTRINFERGDAVGVLLHDPKDDTVVLVRQFRYPVYASLTPEEHVGDGAQRAWSLEIIAGIVDEGQSVMEVAYRESLEETGYTIKHELQPIATVYPSPGGSSERVHLLWGEIDRGRRTSDGGGVVAEGEDIQIVVLPFHQAMNLVARGEICDAKTIIALQHLALLKVKGIHVEISP